MKLDEYFAINGAPLSKGSGNHLFRQGDLDQSLYFVKSGLLKAYYLSESGKEHIKSFILPGDTIGSLTALGSGNACTFNLVCLKPCDLTVVESSVLYKASRADIELSASIVDFLLGFAKKKEKREFELLCLSAEERYTRLQENTPDILKLVTQNEIARYLGVTPVGLSRIKTRLAR